MKRSGTAFAAAALGVALSATMALGQAKTPEGDAAKGAASPVRVTGSVVRVDNTQNKVTVRADDGKTYEFQASKETLQDLKVGDRIEAALRAPAKR